MRRGRRRWCRRGGSSPGTRRVCRRSGIPLGRRGRFMRGVMCSRWMRRRRCRCVWMTGVTTCGPMWCCWRVAAPMGPAPWWVAAPLLELAIPSGRGPRSCVTCWWRRGRTRSRRRPTIQARRGVIRCAWSGGRRIAVCASWGPWMRRGRRRWCRRGGSSPGTRRVCRRSGIPLGRRGRFMRGVMCSRWMRRRRCRCVWMTGVTTCGPMWCCWRVAAPMGPAPWWVAAPLLELAIPSGRGPRSCVTCWWRRGRTRSRRRPTIQARRGVIRCAWSGGRRIAVCASWGPWMRRGRRRWCRRGGSSPGTRRVCRRSGIPLGRRGRFMRGVMCSRWMRRRRCRCVWMTGVTTCGPMWCCWRVAAPMGPAPWWVAAPLLELAIPSGRGPRSCVTCWWRRGRTRSRRRPTIQARRGVIRCAWSGGRRIAVCASWGPWMRRGRRRWCRRGGSSPGTRRVCRRSGIPLGRRGRFMRGVMCSRWMRRRRCRCVWMTGVTTCGPMWCCWRVAAPMGPAPWWVAAPLLELAIPSGRGPRSCVTCWWRRGRTRSRRRPTIQARRGVIRCAWSGGRRIAVCASWGPWMRRGRRRWCRRGDHRPGRVVCVGAAGSRWDVGDVLCAASCVHVGCGGDGVGACG